MYLKSLVLKGFKSFVDRSVLTLEPGITVIVGPNGSGKSNISDAVLWVLGEQSAKQLRAQLMEDVIFSGSPERGAVGVAEVDLVLDNSCGTLPLDFEEVVITRRMYRSGDSEYLINGSPSLLRDILDILHDSGIGRDTHSIISQGMLAEVLESKPEERRTLIEEAAGILKHKKRKERSSRKIASMDAHLERVNDVAKEMDRRLKPLERQAKRAQEYDTFTGELRQLELQLAVDDLRELQAVWNSVDKRDREADAEVEIVRMRYQEKEAELEKLQKTLQEKGLFVGDLAAQRSRCQFIMGSLNSSMLLLEEKGKNMVERTSELRGTVYRSERGLREATEEYDRCLREGEETQAAYAEFTRELALLNRESEKIRKQRMQSDESFSRMSTNLRGLEKAIDDCTLRIGKSRQQIENNTVQDDLLKNRFSQIEEQYLTTQQSLAERRAKLEELEGQLARNRKDSELAKLDIDKRVRLLGQRREELDRVREEHNAIKAELKGLLEVDRAFETASPALAWVLAHEEEFRGTIRPISELFRAPKEYESLLEHLLGADLFGLLTDDLDESAAIAGRLLREAGGQGEISLLPRLATREVSHERPKKGKRLLDYLDYEDSVAAAATALLGDVYVVDSVRAGVMAHNEDTSKSRFVTRDGAVVWPNGKITLGIQVNDTEGVFARKRRQGILEEEITSVTAALSEAEMAVSEAEEALRLAQEDDFELSQNIAMLRGENDSVREAVGRLEQSMTSMTAERDGILASRAKVQEASDAAQPLIAELELRKEKLAADLAELEEQIAAGSDERVLRLEAENEIRERISTCKVDIATAQTRSIYLKQRTDTLKGEIRELKRTIEVSRETQASLDVLSRRAEPIYRLLEEINGGVKVWAEKLKDQAALEQTDSVNLQETVDAAKEAVRKAKEALDAKIESVSGVRVEKGKIETQVEAAIRDIVEDHDILLESALETPPPSDRKAAEDRVIRLRRMIAGIGPVNQVAKQDYEALKTRREYISSQLADLEGARKALSKIVAAIDRKMRNRFLETFEMVDANFQQIFEQLFPGGHAHLSLTDPDNPEATGVEVSAQPAGKQIKKLISMSGGEKSLTALALLFAVYRTRTVPFYILDEVEAALDDTNLRRMVAYLDSLRNDTQFILITHQRRTMEMADVLYGVSMQADGVSKVVSQKLERAIAQYADDATPEDVQRAIDLHGEELVRQMEPARPVSSRPPAVLRNKKRK